MVYLYNEKVVPRVTEIISDMDRDENLLEWIRRTALYKHEDPNKIRDISARIGTLVHHLIEVYINDVSKFETIKEIIKLEPKDVDNAFTAFLNWYLEKFNNCFSVEIIATEKQLVCESYGGTCDLLIKLDDKVCLVDFKTSNSIHNSHFIQLSAYRKLLEENGIHIDKCIILHLSKTNASFTEYELDIENTEDANYLNLCEKTFMSMLEGYTYKNETKNIFKGAMNNEKSNFFDKK